MTLRALRSLLLPAALLLVAGRASAQNSIKSSITVSSLTLSFPTPTPTNYDNGSVAASSPITLTFDSKKNAGGQPVALRTSTFSIRSSSANLGNGKPLSDLQWMGGTQATFKSLTQLDATVESRQFLYNGQNDPWSATVNFQMLLGWTTTPPGAYSATIVFTLTITTP